MKISSAIIDSGPLGSTRLTHALQEALAGADTGRLKDATARWAATEEFGGVEDPLEIGECLIELVALARTAERDKQRMYCWQSV